MDTAKLLERRERDRRYQAEKRKSRGATPHAESAARTKPWERFELSRTRFYALLKAGQLEEYVLDFWIRSARGTNSSATGTVLESGAPDRSSPLHGTNSSDSSITATLPTKQSSEAEMWERLIANAPAARAELAGEPWPTYR